MTNELVHMNKLPDFSQEIWEMKYQFNNETLQEMFIRIANDLSKLPNDFEDFISVLEQFKFIPAGRVIAGAGTNRNVTMFNCYVMGTIHDSMDGIFSSLREAALTLQQGGGIGYDFSTIRPKGALVKGVDSDASGPLSFMDTWDSMCRTILSAGTRRGAMMATLRCDHPDIFDFVHAKKEKGRFEMFNVSVLVTDKFMEAVKNNDDWELNFNGEVYDKFPAKELWDAIMTSTYNYAEPGVIFIDRINKTNNLKYTEKISSTNPCGEQPLPPYGACLLGSLNLSAFVKNEFEDDSFLDFNELKRATKIAVRMLDSVIDSSNFPLNEQLKEAKSKRRMGIGITGLGDALFMLGKKYGSDESALFVKDVMKTISIAAYEQSIDLAVQFGHFEKLQKKAFLNDTSFFSRIYNELNYLYKQKFLDYGIRNSHLISIAPTGTISIVAGNVSSGIEPIFMGEYKRKVIQEDGSRKESIVKNYSYSLYEQKNFPLPAHYVEAKDVTPLEHLKMQSYAQKWVDSSISKTLNLPTEISFDDFKNIYFVAYNQGCKGCTTYRPNDIRGSVIEEIKKEETEEQLEKNDEHGEIRSISSYNFHCFDKNSEKPIRKKQLNGKTYKEKLGEETMYITINDEMTDDGLRPFEIFINTKNPMHYSWSNALMRMISAVWRRGGDFEFVTEELQEIFDPKGGAWKDGQFIKSVPALIGKVIEDHMKSYEQSTSFEEFGEVFVHNKINFDVTNNEIFPKEFSSEGLDSSKQISLMCPHCYETMIMESGCKKCPNCSHSECG